MCTSYFRNIYSDIEVKRSLIKYKIILFGLIKSIKIITGKHFQSQNIFFFIFVKSEVGQCPTNKFAAITTIIN